MPAVNHTEERPHWLPDFCSLPVLFAVMVVAELLVLVAEIAPSDETRPLLPRLATVSVFAQWLALVCAVCLCKLRPQLERLSPWLGVLAAYALMLAITVIGSALVFEIDHQLGLNLTLPTQFQGRFVWRSAALCALLGAALLRYFYVLEQWRARVRAEAKARFEALQARIRPHFLFNSMNTIASLIRSRPAEAERAVEDLSDLFRAAPIFMAHGMLDPTISHALGEMSRDYLVQRGYAVAWHAYPMAHQVCMEEIAGLRQWLGLRLSGA
jgi:two-component system sensor histidine kinase AlgZ